MNANPLNDTVRMLALRRKKLGMPWDAVAKRSKLSRATAMRILGGSQSEVSFAKVAALAAALGVAIKLQQDEIPAEDFVDAQATRQATRLVKMIQGTMGLEAQGIDPDQADEMVRKTRHELLAGSRKRLWGE
jgi:transcriptional regulator with XRE-family HTH domain